MQIKKLELKNFAIFEDLVVDFAPQNQTQGKVTVFIGNNGTGKTAILKALALSLSSLVAQIKWKEETGDSIDTLDIFNADTYSKITLAIEEDNNFQTPLEKYRIGVALFSSIEDLTKYQKEEHPRFSKDIIALSNPYRMRLAKDKEASLPLIMYYPVERIISDIDLEIREGQSLKQFEGYENCFSGQVDFKRFFSWYREREDIENEKFAQIQREKRAEIDRSLNLSIEERYKYLVSNFLNDKQLKVVRTAIHNFMPEFSNLRVERMPFLRMLVDKKGSDESLNILQLSQGEKSLMALVGDIARRLAIMNPALENPLLGEGVVMIDEIDMHLHPKWQRSIVQNLQNTFPNCQFILTTHSPAVISDSPNLLVYELNDGEVNQIDNLYGMDVNMVLLQGMDAEIRNAQIQQQLDDLLNTIQLQDLNSAKQKLAELEKQLPSDNLELIKARLLLRKMELRHAQNQQK